MILFASDLDNTLIHSYKVAKSDEMCIEYKDGKALSFISEDALNLLNKVRALCEFVPVTTRSLEQYNRINFGFVPHYALVAHGALLLVDGRVDDDWQAESLALLQTSLPTIRKSPLVYDVRYVNEYFIFAKSDEPETAIAWLKSVIDTEAFFICRVHNKVYVFPYLLTKGVAVERLKKRLNPTKTFCAGDSELDFPMLQIADESFLAYSHNSLSDCSVDNAKIILQSIIPLING